MICDLLESTYDFADAPRPAHSGALMPAEVSVMRSCLQQDLGIRNPASLYWLITAGQRAACARFTHSSRSVSELTFTVSQATRGWVHARRPVSGVAADADRVPAGPRAVGVGLRPRCHRPRGLAGCSPRCRREAARSAMVGPAKCMSPSHSIQGQSPASGCMGHCSGGF